MSNETAPLSAVRVEPVVICDDNFGNQQLLKDIAPHCHMIDIRVRLNGKYYWFEGDFLKRIFPFVRFNQIDNGIKTKLENHEERTDN